MEKQTSRLEAFSDGVFAIAITLLVLELKVPTFTAANATLLSLATFPTTQPTSAQLGYALLRDWPSYLALVTSFFTVLIMWVHHHAMFKLVRTPDAFLLFANGLLLMLVTIVPYPTAVVARYLLTPAAPMATAFYAGFFVLIAIAFRLTMTASFRQGVVDPAASQVVLIKFRKNYRIGPPAYMLATVSAFLSPWLCLALCTALWIFWAAMTIERREDI